MIEVHRLEGGAYRQAQAAAGDDTVQSVLLPDLRFDANRVFELPYRPPCEVSMNGR
jgi:hypothetical protein